MSKTWTFIGGELAGIASVFAAAAVATGLEARKGSSSDTVEETRGATEIAASPEREETPFM